MQFNQIIKNCNKIVNVNDVMNNIDLITDIIKEDIFKITKSKGIYFPDFDFAYNNGLKQLKNQLTKIHLKGTKRFFECNSIENALKWIVSRIINNAVNISTNKKYKLYTAPQFSSLHENIESSYDIDMLLINDDLMKFDKNTLKIGLKKVWEDSKYDQDFDYEDFEELCCKFGFSANAVVGSHVFEEPKLSKHEVGIGQFQLKLLF